MRVAVVLEGWGKGGTETYVTGLVRLLQAHSIDVFLVLLRKDNADAVNFLPKDKVFVTDLVGLGSLLRRKRPDVVNIHLYTKLLPAVLICAGLRKKPVTTLHMPLKSWGLRHRYYWRLAISLSSCVVGVSKSVLAQLNGNNKCEHPIPGGVGHQFFGVSRKARRKQTDEFRIVAIGRLSVEKDWPTLFEAVAFLPDHLRVRVTIDFYGSGKLQPDLEVLASQDGVQAVFHGNVAKNVLVKALSRADLSVLPSRFEGLGLSALEGMAVGVPTITADFAAAHDFIEHGVTGHMFPIGNAPALAQLIEWHITHPAESEAIGQAGRERAKSNYSEEVAYLPYLEIFRQAANLTRAV